MTGASEQGRSDPTQFSRAWFSLPSWTLVFIQWLRCQCAAHSQGYDQPDPSSSLSICNQHGPGVTHQLLATFALHIWEVPLPL